MSANERLVTEPGVNSLSVNLSGVSLPPGASSSDICSLGAGLLDVGLLGVGLSGVGSLDIDLLGVGPSGVDSLGIDSLGIDLLGTGSLGIDLSGIDLLGVGLLGIASLLDGVDSVGNVNMSHWGRGGLETNKNILSTSQALVESTCHLPTDNRLDTFQMFLQVPGQTHDVGTFMEHFECNINMYNTFNPP